MTLGKQVVFSAVVCLVFCCVLFLGTTTADGQGKPVFTEYRGISIGMAADEVRKKLGDAKEKSDAEDDYEFENDEFARILYDGEKKVRTISVTYKATDSNAPTVEKVFGAAAEANDDGSVFKMERYEDEGFWVSYFLTSGDDAVIIITIQKL